MLILVDWRAWKTRHFFPSKGHGWCSCILLIVLYIGGTRRTFLKRTANKRTANQTRVFFQMCIPKT